MEEEEKKNMRSAFENRILISGTHYFTNTEIL
jgi:hypothetical protein